MHKLNTLKHPSAIQNFCLGESNSQARRWVPDIIGTVFDIVPVAADADEPRQRKRANNKQCDLKKNKK